jgi:hypothetical protein
MRPSRGRRLADVEKERARLAVRSLVGDPVTDFAALDAEKFIAGVEVCLPGRLGQCGVGR